MPMTVDVLIFVRAHRRSGHKWLTLTHTYTQVMAQRHRWLRNVLHDDTGDAQTLGRPKRAASPPCAADDADHLAVVTCIIQYYAPVHTHRAHAAL